MVVRLDRCSTEFGAKANLNMLTRGKTLSSASQARERKSSILGVILSSRLCDFQGVMSLSFHCPSSVRALVLITTSTVCQCAGLQRPRQS
jgi:hypothetical protein